MALLLMMRCGFGWPLASDRDEVPCLLPVLSRGCTGIFQVLACGGARFLISFADAIRLEILLLVDSLDGAVCTVHYASVFGWRWQRMTILLLVLLSLRRLAISWLGALIYYGALLVMSRRWQKVHAGCRCRYCRFGFPLASDRDEVTRLLPALLRGCAGISEGTDCRGAHVLSSFTDVARLDIPLAVHTPCGAGCTSPRLMAGYVMASQVKSSG